MGRRSRTRLYTRCINNDYVTNVSALDPRTHNGVRECVCMCMCGLHNIELSILRTNFVAGGIQCMAAVIAAAANVPVKTRSCCDRSG